MGVAHFNNYTRRGYRAWSSHMSALYGSRLRGSHPGPRAMLKNIRSRSQRTMTPRLREWLRTMFTGYRLAHSPARLRTMSTSYGRLRALQTRRVAHPFREDAGPFKPSQRAFNRG